MVQIDGPGYFRPDIDPDSFILESAGIEGDPEAKYPVDGYALEALTVLAQLTGNYVGDKDRQSLLNIFQAFDTFKEQARSYWRDLYAESLDE